MSLLTVVQSVCAVVGVMRPTAVIPNVSSNRTMFEMLELANTMAQRIAYDTREWGELKSLAVFEGGVSMTIEQGLNSCFFLLPVDYKRMLLTSQVWRSTSTLTPMQFIADTEEWTQRRFANWYASQGEWAIHQGGFHIAPALVAAKANAPKWVNNLRYMPGDVVYDPDDNAHDPTGILSSYWKCLVEHDSPMTGTLADYMAANMGHWTGVAPMVTPAETVHFNYLSGSCIKLSTTGFSDRFVDDADTFRLDERLLILGMIWQWKANKGSPYAEDMANYQDALTRAMGSDKPAPIIVGRRPVSAYATVAIPWGPGWGPQ